MKQYDINLNNIVADNEEFKIIKWLKNIGENTEVDMPIVEIETQKVVYEVLSPQKGILCKIFYNEGEKSKGPKVIGSICI